MARCCQVVARREKLRRARRSNAHSGGSFVTDSAASPVLVAGAGPVGLTAALMLARHGTPVRIIDRDEAPTDLSKALVVWKRTLETLDPILPFERFSAEHPVLHGLSLGLAPGKTIEVEMPSEPGEAPACVLVPQSATERILLNRVEQLGVTVERRTELTTFMADADGVTCEIRGPGGTEHARTPWLVGCDGAHSVVRHGLGLGFVGETLHHRWMLADIDIEADPRPDDHHILIRSNNEGIVALFPMGGGRWRVIADMGPVEEAGPEGEISIADVQRLLDARTTLGWKIVRSHWTSEYGVNERQVPGYVHGRVLVAGDAAHVHSPAGGQGMNTGMQDAANLAWKIALIERGAADHALLDTYQAERHPVGEAVLKQSGAMLRMGMLTGPKRFARNHLMPVAMSLPVVRRRLIEFLTEEAVSYREGPLADGSGHHGGAHSGDGWPLSRGAQAELVLLGEAARDAAPDTFGGPDGLPLTVTRAEVDGHLEDRLGHDSGAVLVRPDGIVASVGKDAETATAWMRERIQAVGTA